MLIHTRHKAFSNSGSKSNKPIEDLKRNYRQSISLPFATNGYSWFCTMQRRMGGRAGPTGVIEKHLCQVSEKVLGNSSKQDGKGTVKGHPATVCDCAAQKGWGCKRWKGRKNVCISFLLCWNISASMRGNVIWTTCGAHSSKSQGQGALAGRPGARRGQSDLLTKKEIRKKKDLGKSYTAFRSNFYPVSLWKPPEQAQCFKAEAANIPRKVPVFNKLFWLEFKGKVKISVGLAIENVAQTCNPISDQTKMCTLLKIGYFSETALE